MVTILVSTISISQVVLLKKKVSVQKLLTFFSKNISVYAIFNDLFANKNILLLSFED